MLLQLCRCCSMLGQEMHCDLPSFSHDRVNHVLNFFFFFTCLVVCEPITNLFCILQHLYSMPTDKYPMCLNTLVLGVFLVVCLFVCFPPPVETSLLELCALFLQSWSGCFPWLCSSPSAISGWCFLFLGFLYILL